MSMNGENRNSQILMEVGYVFILNSGVVCAIIYYYLGPIREPISLLSPLKLMGPAHLFSLRFVALQL